MVNKLSDNFSLLNSERLQAIPEFFALLNAFLSDSFRPNLSSCMSQDAKCGEFVKSLAMEEFRDLIQGPGVLYVLLLRLRAFGGIFTGWMFFALAEEGGAWAGNLLAQRVYGVAGAGWNAESRRKQRIAEGGIFKGFFFGWFQFIPFRCHSA
jgi:hypothetical protein